MVESSLSNLIFLLYEIRSYTNLHTKKFSVTNPSRPKRNTTAGNCLGFLELYE